MVAVAVLLAVLGVRARWDKHGEHLGWQPLSASLVEAVRNCPDRLFNHLEDGGPLMWALPSRHVFVDSRMNAYPLTLLERSRNADLLGEYADLFREYGIDCAVVATDSTLARRLELDAAMRRTYSDRQRTVFARSVDAYSPASSRVNSGSTQNFADPTLQ
jgi:CubicO group peptidase (beta-lactamase class C family)